MASTQQNQRFTPQQALPKAKTYCAYQERCHSEVSDKLFGFGLNKEAVDKIISQLIEENFLNEERFAIAFTGGHFRTKQWGRVKIKYELKKKQVSEYCVKKALASINSVDYSKTLFRLADKKILTLKNEKNIFTKRKKLSDFLLQKGYESNLIREIINDL